MESVSLKGQTYELLERIGEGGQGHVWRARQGPLHYAIKELLAEQLADPVQLRRACQEGRIGKRLSHDCDFIARVHDFGWADAHENTRHLLVMTEFSGDAAQWATTQRTLAEVFSCAVQIAYALTEAHAHNIVHRDVKPANIFVVPGPSAAPAFKLGDWGIAYEANQTAGPARTQVGLTPGSPPYIAPECQSTRAADWYSLGVTIGALLTGEPVLFVNDLGEPTIRRAGEPYPKLATRTTVPIPHNIAGFVDGLTLADPGERMNAVGPNPAIRLDALLKELLQPAPATNDAAQQTLDHNPAGRRAQPNPPPKTPRRGFWAFVLIACAAIAAVVAWDFWTDRRPERPPVHHPAPPTSQPHTDPLPAARADTETPTRAVTPRPPADVAPTARRVRRVNEPTPERPPITKPKPTVTKPTVTKPKPTVTEPKCNYINVGGVRRCVQLPD